MWEFPVSLPKIPVTKQLNNLRFNAVGFEEEEVCPLYISEKQNLDEINLLLVYDGEKQHYCFIRSFSRVLGDMTKYGVASFCCYQCFHHFSREDLLNKHVEFCSKHVPQAVRIPSENYIILQFSSIHLQHPILILFKHIL